ncbi:glucose dehydrogenase [Adhaeribacter aerolatus]|uniref:Glucose dehydrogenase n=1 Tax=Adhaeribacter aerolatus TaxID=670289 RepID=A0A512B1U4_9BACT|nr:PQQ-dependent sugar dehydrogenase [Adhaeribacter aerolatus]GEO05909.1 glucose dehydrogenase [Adhaeribacter aerolatus]
MERKTSTASTFLTQVPRWSRPAPAKTTPNRLFSTVGLALLLSTLLLQSCQEEIKEAAPTDSQTSEELSVAHFNMKPVDLAPIATNLVSPLGVEEAPDGSNRLFILDQIGKIWIVNAADNQLTTPFLDVTSKMVTLNPRYDERGLLGFTFHPDFKNNGRFFIYYTLPPRPGGPTPTTTWNNLSRISEFRVSAGNPNVADLSTEKVILELDDPQSNHNGGTIAFGPDGYLYIAIGDGGGANDVDPGHVEDWYPVNKGGNGQDIEANLFGNILRLDVNSGAPYRIPADNPFVGKTGRDEIWAYGFRNPFRFSFDMSGSRRMFAGDAGQLLFEEIDVVEKGQNYGWNVKEGTSCFNAADPLKPLASCPSVDVYGRRLINPVIQVNNYRNPVNGRATTIIGGNVYRGNDIPGFQGKYIFGTFSQNPGTPDAELFISQPSGPGLWDYREINLVNRPDDLGYYLKGFGQDLEGEIYLTVSELSGPTGNTGKVFKLVLADKEKGKGKGHAQDNSGKDNNRGKGRG